MNRRLLLLATLLVIAVALAGCDDGSVSESTEESATATDTAAPVTAPLEGYDAMPADGPNESAALAALPDAIADAKAAGEPAGVDWTSIEGAEPRLVAYLARVDLGGQAALFEVRADGVPHNIYGYQRAFDSGSINWTAADAVATAPVEPQSTGELNATAAVEVAMLDAFPDNPLAAAIHGYRFAYVLDGAEPVVIEIAPDGSVISISG